MKRIFTVFLLLVSLLIASTNIEAKKTASKKSSTTASYDFYKTDEGFVSPYGHAYSGRTNGMKITYVFRSPQYLTAIFSDGRYESDYTYSWDQENDIVYIDMGDDLATMKLSADGKSLKDLEYDVIFKIIK